MGGRVEDVVVWVFGLCLCTGGAIAVLSGNPNDGWGLILVLFALFIFYCLCLEIAAFGKRRRVEEENQRKKLQQDEEEQRKILQLQREELARQQWEQSAEGQAFREQQRREAEEKERAEMERRKKEVQEAEEKERMEMERHKKEAEEWAREDWRRWHESKTVSEIAEMSGLEFEAFLYRLLTQMGYTDLQLTPINDQGGDIVGNSPERIRTVVQAKRWKNTIGNAVIQELLGAMLHYGAISGMVITNSKFTEAARQLAAKDNRINLCDGHWLETQIRKFLPPTIPEFDWAKYNELASREKQINTPHTSKATAKEFSPRRKSGKSRPEFG